MTKVKSTRARLADLVHREDFLTGAVTSCAMLVFVASAGRALRPALDKLLNHGGGADQVAIVALLLNIALLLFAWSRHREARQAMRQSAAAEERANQFRTRDLQTQLLNRQSLRDRCGHLIATAREQRGNLALMVINLNRFKRINEIYGETVGDGLLRMIAGLLLGIVPRNGLCARLGADEFAVALPFEKACEDRVNELAADIAAQLNRPIELMGAELKVSASVGVSRLAYDCSDFSTLLRRADIAMNAAKESGKSRPLWFDAKMERALRTQNEVELGLRGGIAGGEFVPYFQPQVEFESGRLKGFEMLARWHHPAGGVVGPDVFIPVAEETGLIGELFETLARAAFLEARQWNPAISLSVNISPRQLSDPWLAEKILKLLTETGFPAQRLEVEITESSLFENLEVAQAVVASLKAQGIKLSLDDFGTGYSSLAHLRALPFDRIKIDRSFVLALNKDPQSWAMVQSIADLGRNLGVPITVEGVESAAIELRVRQLGCEVGQGWFYGQAAPAVETRRLIAEHDLGAEFGSAVTPLRRMSPRAQAA
jgi:diguanylate cyclase (GGDEF)-like protein